jgi:ABC-type uncharacterized transport system substrate-binding protein
MSDRLAEMRTRGSRWRWWFVALVALLVACQPAGGQVVAPTPTPSAADGEPLRLFWVNSYTEDSRWALQVQTGIREALARQGYGFADGNVVWGAYHLGVEQAVSSIEVQRLGSEIIEEIRAFEPDVVIVSDDEAVTAVATRVSALDVPLVYCGVNAPVEDTGLLEIDAVGVVERLYARQTVAMARELVGGEGPFLVMGDSSVTGIPSTFAVYEELQQAGADLSASAVVEVAEDWETWQETVITQGAEADFILLTNYLALPDRNGEPVSEQVMMAWMYDHAPVPVFALWNSAVIDGAVGGLVVDRFQQGNLAAQLALGVARDHDVSGTDQAMGMNRLVLNAAAARYWDLQIPVLFPIIAHVYNSVPVAQEGTF